MKPLSFRAYMLMLALIPTIVVAVFLSGIYVSWNHHEVDVALRERGRAIARQLGTSAEYGLFSGARDDLRKLADAAYKGDGDVLGAAVLDIRGQVMVRVGDVQPDTMPALDASEQVIELAERIQLLVPIRQSQVSLEEAYGTPSSPAPVVGYVLLEMSQKRLLASLNTQLLIGLNIALGGLVLGVWFAVRMSRGITQPLTHVIDVVERIGHGELHARVDTNQTLLFESLAVNINAMAERITMAQDELQQKIDHATHELITRKEEAELLARIDVLTGIPNRRAFMQAAEQEVLRAQRYGTPLSVAILDLDHFKSVNDNFGHGVGDQVLISRANLLSETIREVDLVGRLGGEEFAILMPGTPLGEAIQAVERIRQLFEQSPVHLGGHLIRSTASFGVADYPGADPTVDSLLVKADDALYMAKARGRNRVETASSTATSKT